MMVKEPRSFINDSGGVGSARHMAFGLFATIVSEEGRVLDESESVTSKAGFGNVLYVDPRDVYLRGRQLKFAR
jgi:hypothetical protein